MNLLVLMFYGLIAYIGCERVSRVKRNAFSPYVLVRTPQKYCSKENVECQLLIQLLFKEDHFERVSREKRSVLPPTAYPHPKEFRKHGSHEYQLFIKVFGKEFADDVKKQWDNYLAPHLTFREAKKAKAIKTCFRMNYDKYIEKYKYHYESLTEPPNKNPYLRFLDISRNMILDAQYHNQKLLFKKVEDIVKYRQGRKEKMETKGCFDKNHEEALNRWEDYSFQLSEALEGRKPQVWYFLKGSWIY